MLLGFVLVIGSVVLAVLVGVSVTTADGVGGGASLGAGRVRLRLLAP